MALDDPFAFQVSRLTRQHRDRHDAATVAQVTLQQWLAMRHRFNDPFDAELFDHIDARLGAMPASVEDPAAAVPAKLTPADHAGRARSGRLTSRGALPRSA